MDIIQRFNVLWLSNVADWIKHMNYILVPVVQVNFVSHQDSSDYHLSSY